MSIKIDGMSICDYIKKQRQEGEVIESMNGSTVTNYNSRGRSVTMINGGSVVITRKGKTFTLRGSRIEQRGGEWFVDGKRFDFDGEQMKLEDCTVKIEIHGEVERLETESGDVTVYGDCHHISTQSGDVTCQEAVNISTMSGDVTCKGRPNSVNTMSGDINC